MRELVIVDHVTTTLDLLTEKLGGNPDWSVLPISDPRDAMACAESRSSAPPDAVVVDFLDPRHKCNGLDIMLAFSRWCPESAIVVYTEGSPSAISLLAIAWEAIRPASAVSKLSPVAILHETIDCVLQHGSAEVDPVLRSLLPRERSPWRTVDGYRRLVPHAGHAKVWLALIESDGPPTYKQIAESASLSVNTVRSYREGLVAELRLHGLPSPTIRQLHEFAQLIRPLLSPVLVEHLGARVARQVPIPKVPRGETAYRDALRHPAIPPRPPTW
jgi:DNA-binding NarL/FixJ family response regulator